jgi:hypothetical protein
MFYKIIYSYKLSHAKGFTRQQGVYNKILHLHKKYEKNILLIIIALY